MPCDYSIYPPDWDERRERILVRAGQCRDGSGKIVQDACCERCGAENNKPHPETESRVILTIAHLDHDPENWEVEDDRLMALCQKCHLRYDYLCRKQEKHQLELFA